MKKFFYRRLFLFAMMAIALPMQAKADLAIIVAGDAIFDNVVVGQSKTMTVEIRNIGTSPLSIDGKQGPMNGEYVANNLIFPIPISAGGSYTFTVTFTPTAVQKYEGDGITFMSNAQKEDHTTVLSGSGVKADIVLGAPCAFGKVRLNKASGNCILGATNTGSADASVTDVTSIGADSTQFSVNTASLVGVYGPSITKSSPITFNPTSVGDKKVSFTFVTTSLGNFTTQEWTGTGVTAELSAPNTAFARGPQFGTIEISVPVIGIDGAFKGAVKITDYQITGPDSAAFTKPTYLGLVQPGQTLIIKVPVKSDVAKVNKATLSIITDADNNFGVFPVALTAQIDAVGVEEAGVAAGYSLGTSVPNPAYGASKINFSIATPARTSVVLYNALGVAVKVLVDQDLAEGAYSTSFDAKELASGTYFYKISSGTFTATKSVIIAR